MKQITYIFIALSLSFSSCVRYEADAFTGKTLPRMSGYNTGVTNDWIYFNLRTGEIFNQYTPNSDIAEGQQHNRTDWDIAFCGYRIRTNSGTSGEGKGGAIDLGYENYNHWQSVSQLPSNAEWTVDDHSVSLTMSRNDWNKYLITNHLDFKENPWFDPNKGPATTKTNANPLLAQAMTFNGPPPAYIPSLHTYVIRTADGKRFFKLQIVSWYKSDVEIGDTGGEMSYYCDEIK